MSTQRDTKVIAVLGATGNQGGGVVQALLKKKSSLFYVRAITRDVSSPGAMKLRSKFENDYRLQIVSADVYDGKSLMNAFHEVHGVFALTNNRLPGKKMDREEDLDHELQAGRNIIDAAKACNVQHVVLSSLPNIAEASNQKFTKVIHFDNKSKIEKWARDELLAVTALHPGFFYPNMKSSQWCQLQDDGTVRFCSPVQGDTLADWVDPGYDIGIYTAGHFEPTPLEQWGATIAAAAGKGYEEDMKQMMKWVSIAPDNKICYGTIDPKDDQSWEDLGVKASTFAEWVERESWKGP